MKKIVIVNGWSDLNTGDSAIVMCIIKRLQTKFKNSDITILSELHKKNKYFKTSIDEIKRYYTNVKLVSSPFYKNYSSSSIDRLKEITSFSINIISLLLPAKVFSLVHAKSNDIKELRTADIIISKGGHFLQIGHGLHGLVHTMKCTYPLLCARKLKKRYAIIAQSIGPFETTNLIQRIQYNAIKKTLDSAAAISLRENESYNKAVEHQLIDKNKTYLTSDYAFLLETCEENRLPYELRTIINAGKFVIITIRQWTTNQNDYIKSILKIARCIRQDYGLNVVFVSHVQGPNPLEDDRVITRKIEQLDKNKEFLYVNNKYDAVILKTFYSKAEALIGTRFHSVIFALGSCVPILAISYSGYKANIVKQFGLEKYMIDIESLNNAYIENTISLVRELLDNRAKIRKTISRKLQIVLKAITEDKAFARITSDKKD